MSRIKRIDVILKSLNRRLFSAKNDIDQVSVLMVCTANYCRSPMAEGMLRQHLFERGLSKQVTVDSAGSHVSTGGLRPDPRARQVVLNSGMDIGRLRSRRVEHVDFAEFDYILAMDNRNYERLFSICPDEYRHKLAMLMSFAPQADVIEVPDPYYSNNAGFKQVYTLLRQAIVGLVTSIEERKHLS